MDTVDLLALLLIDLVTLPFLLPLWVLNTTAEHIRRRRQRRQQDTWQLPHHEPEQVTRN